MTENGVKLAKKLLRKKIMNKLKLLTQDEKLKQSIILEREVLNHEKWITSHKVSIFLSMNDEINTVNILNEGFKNNKKMFIPRFSKTEMQMLELTSMQDYENLPSNKWNIKQPSSDDDTRKIINPQNGGLDLIIMPGLAFTRDGYRLGRGGGYYDTYLNNYKLLFGKLPYLLAPTFTQQIVEKIPCTELDFKVDEVLWPQ